ncbi:MAG: hypothetical protein AUG46_09240 [Acidobacteria bacterium 13_1_20CM_3_58_11]|nr:MAG: hypothetical protein AUG46_09240 [Acidobacteria bacterium 13_1_20CM_3_58_11]
MAQVYPFRAFRYNPARARFERVLTQPYDKISPAMQEKYYTADPHNLIAVEKGRAYPGDTPQNNVYTRAAAAIEDWIRNQVVVRDPVPSFYAYKQEYTAPGTEEWRTRRGFIGAGKLEEYSARVVFRHEHTLSGPKADRLELLRHTKTHTGQLFMLYSDAQKRIDAILEEAESTAAPATEMRDECGVVHRLWVIAEPQRVAAIQKAMEDHNLVIADGHHRYETALKYRNERRTRPSGLRVNAEMIDPEAPYERGMMTFINTQSEGLTILPTHRVAANVHDFSWSGVRRHLEPWFAAEAFPFSGSAERSEAKKKFLAKLMSAREKRAIGVYPAAETQKRAFYVLTLREGVNLAQLLPKVSPLQRELDVVLLHEGILEPALGITPQAVTAEANLTYEREALAALDAVDSGRAQISFLLNPCDVEQVMKVATAGEVMPQKSTDFYPKLMSGITMYRVET